MDDKGISRFRKEFEVSNALIDCLVKLADVSLHALVILRAKELSTKNIRLFHADSN